MAKITVALLRELENQCDKGYISFSRMVEILNEHAAKDDAPVDPIPWPEQAAWENAPEGTFARAVGADGNCYFYTMSLMESEDIMPIWWPKITKCGKIPDMTNIDWRQTLQFKLR